MAEYTVLAASQKKTLDGRNGPMQVIALRLGDSASPDREHDAEWFTKASTAIPPVGSRIEGTLDPSDYGLKFKKAFTGGGGGTFKPRDPKDTAAIQRQHSQHMAVLLLQAKATAGTLTSDDLLPPKVKQLTDWFDDDIAAGVERKHPSQQTSRGLPVRNAPQPTGAPELTTPSGEYPEIAEGDVPWGVAS